MSDIVVIGAGQAGFSLTSKLRALGFDGNLTLIGEESAPPYQRPPLSKAYLKGDMALSRLFFRPEEFYRDNNIALHLADTAIAIDRENQTVTAGGKIIPYDQLALTTGAVPRRLPDAIGGTLKGVHVMRDLADADALSPAIKQGARVLIVGGGYIGLEAAAVCAQRGMSVTLIEMAPRILQRVAAPETSSYFRQLHAANGVNILEGIGLNHLIGETHVTGAALSDGTTVGADVVIVGIGVAPATHLAETAGLSIDNGIAVDSHGRSSDPAIWAAGDCASFPRNGTRIRLESVQNAIDQAELVAENMLGAGKDYAPAPWFWSDQYDVKLQIAGLNTGYDKVAIRHGDTPRALSHWYYARDTLLAVDAMNDPRAYMVGKRLIEAGKSPAATTIADPATDLKALLRG